MYRINLKSCISALTMATSALASMQVAAEIKAREITAAPLTEINEVSDARQVASSRDTANLRCWQYGKLLFEETHLGGNSVPARKDTLVFSSSADSEQRKLHLINAGTATCLYEEI